MSVDILRDSASTRSQRRRNLKGEGYIGVLIEADNVKVNRGAVDAGIAMLRSGGDFADGVIAYEGFALGGEVFATFDKKAVAILKKLGSIRTQLLS